MKLFNLLLFLQVMILKRNTIKEKIQVKRGQKETNWEKLEFKWSKIT